MFCYISVGLEFSGGEGTNYAQKFDSAPGVYASHLYRLFFFNVYIMIRLSAGPVLWSSNWSSLALSLSGAWRTPTEEWGTEDWTEDVRNAH